MLRFGDPFDCDREFKCFECKQPVKKGDKILYEFSQRHRYHQACGEQLKTEDQDKPVRIEFDQVLVEAFLAMCKVKEPAKPGLFSGSSANVGMTSEQSRAFNDLIKRVDSLEKKLKEVTGES